MTPPPCNDSATTMSSRSVVGTPERSMAARTAMRASVKASTSTSEPLRARPIGVRARDTMTASVIPSVCTPRQRLHDGDVVAVGDGEREVAHGFVVEEHLHVLAQPAVLVDHPETQARVAAVEVGEQFGQRGAIGLDH